MPLEDNPYAVPNARVDDIPEVARPGAEAIRRAHIKHELAIRYIGVFFMFGSIAFLGGIGLIVGLAMATGGLDSLPVKYYWWAAMQTFLFLGLFTLGLKVYGLRRSFQIPAIMVCFAGLLWFPFGTFVSPLFLWLMLSKKGRYLMSEEYAPVVSATAGVKYPASAIGRVLLALIVVGLCIALEEQVKW